MISIRTATPEDLPQLKELWIKAFGDSEHYIDMFYQKFCEISKVLVVDEDGELNSMANIITGMEYKLPDGAKIPLGYVYALGTNPYIQGKGYARQLLAYADKFLQEQGYKCMVLVPSSPSLHRFFDNLGMSECFASRKLEIMSTSLADPVEGDSITPVLPCEYNQIRETYLKEMAHITYSDKLIQFQQHGSHLAMGDLYKVEVDGVVGCAAIEYVQRRRLLFKELLLPVDKMMRAVQVAWTILPATRYHIRTPASWEGLPGSYIQSFGMIKWYDRELHQKWGHHQDAYMGLGFD